jgi:cobalt/nickel transport system permease protein
MKLATVHLTAIDSPLRQLDPRWKLAALVPAALIVAALRSVPAVMAALAGAIFMAIISRMGLTWYLRRVAGLGLLLLLFVIFLPFILDGQGPAWDLGPLRFSLHGLTVGVVICCKALAIVSLMLVLLAAAPLEETLKAAHALFVPGLIVQLLLLTYRYTFLLAGELGRLRIALRVRGYRNRASMHSYRTVGHVAGTLLVRSYERAERVGHAMRCRGFDGRFRALVAFRTRPEDVLTFAGILGFAVVLLTWDLAQRY